MKMISDEILSVKVMYSVAPVHRMTGKINLLRDVCPQKALDFFKIRRNIVSYISGVH